MARHIGESGRVAERNSAGREGELGVGGREGGREFRRVEENFRAMEAAGREIEDRGALGSGVELISRGRGSEAAGKKDRGRLGVKDESAGAVVGLWWSENGGDGW